MVTMKDIAQLAGVSSATVSNVLNGKGNVSLEKVKLVLEAAEKTGYSINYPAKQLRQNPSPNSDYSIAIILPNVSEKQYAILYEVIKGYFERHNKTVFLFTTGDIQHEEKIILDTIAAMRMSGVITVSCGHDTESMYAPLKKNGTKLVFILRDPGYRDNFFTFDYYRAGHEMAEIALMQGAKRIGLFSNIGGFSLDEDFVRGVTEQINACSEGADSKPVLTIQKSSPHAVRKNAAALFASESVPDVIICTGLEYGMQVQLALSLCGTEKKPDIITLSHQTMPAPTPAYLEYQLDCQKIAALAAQQLQRSIEEEAVCASVTEVVPNIGFKKEYPLAIHPKKASLNVLLINGPSADALMTLSKRFSNQTGIQIEYTVMSPEEIVQKYLSIEKDTRFDIVRANVSVLPLLPLHAFIPYEETFFRQVTEGMFPNIIKTHSMVGEVPYAIPFDIGGQVLVYRNDIFADPIVQRMYLEQFEKSLEVPSDFDEMNQVARFFNQNLNPYSPVGYGASTGMGNNAEIFISFMTRYRYFDGNKGNDINFDRFDQFAALATIENYIDFCNNCYIMKDSARIETEHEIFVRGECAMEAISFNYGSDLTKIYSFGANRQIGYASIPGGKPMLGGGSMLISRHCKDYSAAQTFVQWACGSQQAENLTYLGGVSPHESVYENLDILNLYPWYRLVKSTLEKICSRNLWDTYNVYSLETLVAGTIKRVLANRLSPREAVTHIGNNIYTCLNPRTLPLNGTARH